MVQLTHIPVNISITHMRLMLSVMKTEFAFLFAGDTNRLNEKIDNLGNEMQWMKNALIEWAKAIDHDENTNALIEKYCKEDKKKADVN